MPGPFLSTDFDEFVPFDPDDVTPKFSPLKNKSILWEFRHSDEYRKLLQKKDRLDMPSQTEDHHSRAAAMVEFIADGGEVSDLMRVLNEDPTPETDEPVPSDVASQDYTNPHDFAYSVMTLLVKKGFDQNMVEVQLNGAALVIYFDERIQPRRDDLQSFLADYGEVELVAKPSDHPELGTYIFQLDYSKEESVTDEDDLIPPKKLRKNGLQSQPDAVNKKGQRVMHDRSRSERRSESIIHGPDLIEFDEDHHKVNSTVWVATEDGPAKVTVTDYQDSSYGGSEQYHLRTQTGNIATASADQLFSTEKDAAKYIKKMTSKGGCFYYGLHVAESEDDDRFETNHDRVKSFIEQHEFEDDGDEGSEFEELEESNPKPKVDDIIVDTSTRKPFKVLGAVNSQNTRVRSLEGILQSQSVPDAPEQVIKTSTIERGLTSGSMIRLNEDEDQERPAEFSEDLETCPSCLTKMESKDDSETFECPGCDFRATFARSPFSATTVGA